MFDVHLLKQAPCGIFTTCEHYKITLRLWDRPLFLPICLGNHGGATIITNLLMAILHAIALRKKPVLFIALIIAALLHDLRIFEQFSEIRYVSP